MFASYSFASRPLASSRLQRPFFATAVTGEFGWAAWGFSRQAKLNAWSWHGLGLQNVYGWASLGSALYLRTDADESVRIMQPDVFLSAEDENTESTSVEATTQWLDFGKPGRMKALTGIDFDGQNIETVEVYVSVDGSRAGQLAASLPIGQNNGGWTYNGEVIPIEVAATEFKLRFVASPNLEAQINRLTLHYDEVSG